MWWPWGKNCVVTKLAAVRRVHSLSWLLRRSQSTWAPRTHLRMSLGSLQAQRLSMAWSLSKGPGFAFNNREDMMKERWMTADFCELHDRLQILCGMGKDGLQTAAVESSSSPLFGTTTIVPGKKRSSCLMTNGIGAVKLRTCFTSEAWLLCLVWSAKSTASKSC